MSAKKNITTEKPAKKEASSSKAKAGKIAKPTAAAVTSTEPTHTKAAVEAVKSAKTPHTKAVAAVEEESHFFREKITGLRLFYRRYLVSNAKRIIVIAHGVGEHSHRYMNVVDYFAPRQTNFFIIDHRGHGRSEGKRGHVLAWGEYLDDFHTLIEIVREEYPHLPIFIIGHSMGGNIAVNYLLQREQNVAGCILSAPAFAPGFTPPKLKEVAGNVCSVLLPGLSLPSGLDTNGISRDQKVVEDYRQDPLVHDLVSARWYTEFLRNAQLAMASADQIHCPLLILQGTADTLISIDKVREFYQKLTLQDKKIHWFDGYFHEVFNELGKEKVFQVMEEWLNQHR